MPNEKLKLKNKIRCFGHLFNSCRLIFIFCAALSVLQISLATVSAYEMQFGGNLKKTPLRWRSGIINLTLSNSLRQPAPNIKPNSDVVGAVQRSLKTWESATNIKFQTVWSDKLSISRADGVGDGASLITIAATPENAAPFQGKFSEMPGRTRTFFDNRGTIVEADIVLNPYQQFSTDGSFGTFDLESALTHEIGHLLGLDHSAVLAATMYSQQGKNGTFSLPAISPRTLAEDDLAGIRTLYGAKTEDGNCCGVVSGAITNSDGRPLSGWQVWAEGVATGKMFAAVNNNEKGLWSISGLPNGKYQIIAQSEKSGAEILGQIIIESDKTAVLNYGFAPRQRFLNPQLLGYNGQLSTLAVPISAGNWQTVFLGGENITPGNLSSGNISTSSPFLQVSAESLTKQNFDAAFPVVSFNLVVDPELPSGEYNLQTQDSNGNMTYLLGCFSFDQN